MPICIVIGDSCESVGDWMLPARPEEQSVISAEYNEHGSSLGLGFSSFMFLVFVRIIYD
ncbi:hypothetical protein ASPFODRAFT_375753 [Aspergillus luchuensis CBS 106.47]|uniref:Uncharacterized protein n=1 Tax=Aspergillus luchuensis (strain CBS 106.47) TaxID=1137211 RepID=A0A1M3T458_ASPLC|nr:hypothetical protein ASPFODRAFT_375753 [Aspergillus luchuensis CBS 106.47]